MDSILTSVKKKIGMEEDYEHFDSDIIDHINSTFMILNQMGVGPSTGYAITGKYETWSDYLGDDELKLNGVKTYVFMKARLVFDPPTSSSLLTALENSIKEYEWRLNVAAESK